MSETNQLTDQVAKLLGDLRTMLEQGGQFIIDQAPPLAREIVAFGRAYETAEMVVCLCFVGWLARFWSKHGPAMVHYLATEKKNGYDEVPKGGVWRVVALVTHAVAVPVTVVITVCQSRDFMLAWFAPRLYILEYVMAALRPRGGCR